MKTKIDIISKLPNEATLKKSKHHLIIVDLKTSQFPFEAILKNKLKRLGKKIDDLTKNPITSELDNGSIISWVACDNDLSVFKIHTLLRKSLAVLVKGQKKIQCILIKQKGKSLHVYCRSSP